MNEALKKERFRTKGQESDASASDGHILNSSQGSRVVCISHTISHIVLQFVPYFTCQLFENLGSTLCAFRLSSWYSGLSAAFHLHSHVSFLNWEGLISSFLSLASGFWKVSGLQ